jgi:flagellar biosynthesis GTPase FlhF
MTVSDKTQLISMGFEEKRVIKALKMTKSSGLQPAIDWLLANPDDVGDDTPEPQMEDDGEIAAGDATAQSLRCDDCEKILRDAPAAEFHAVKTGHTNFSESTEAIKPLTAEEKAQKLKEIQERLAKRREEKRIQEMQEEKEREKIKRASAQEMNAIREKVREDQMKKEVELRKRQKEEDRLAKEKIRQQLEADKLERKRLVINFNIGRRKKNGFSRYYCSSTINCFIRPNIQCRVEKRI